MMVTGATRVFALIGDPVRHSLSPILHNGWIADHGFDAIYVALHLRSDDPVGAVRSLGGLGLGGANVTTPYKRAAAEAAGSTGVANVLRWDESGELTAFNTDGDGLIDSLDEAAPHWRAARQVLVVGAGGAGAAIAAALSPHAERLLIVNRDAARAEQIAASLPNAQAQPWSMLGDAFAWADLIVQSTSIGLESRATQIWPIERCSPKAIVVDIVYKPLETALLADARARGLVAVDGLGMLIHQGARAFELWFGARPDPGIARRRLLEALT